MVRPALLAVVLMAGCSLVGYDDVASPSRALDAGDAGGSSNGTSSVNAGRDAATNAQTDASAHAEASVSQPDGSAGELMADAEVSSDGGNPFCPNGNCAVICEFGKTCKIDCTDVTLCDFQCAPNSTCHADCRGGDGCKSVRCEFGVNCTLLCDDDQDCAFANCPEQKRCDYDLVVCSGECP